MALLRLELEIDSEVYPELYARLASIGRLSAREEKLRQLAATGLVWELVRLHGPALADLGAVQPADDPPGTVLVRPGDLDAVPLPEISRRAPDPAPRPTLQAVAPAVGANDREREAPDLGISVASEPPRDVWPSLPEVPLNLPVLLDVVDEGGPLPPPQDTPSVTMATVVALHGDLEQPAVVDSGAEEAPPPHLAPRSGRSSRLKRMKDRGLFQNG